MIEFFVKHHLLLFVSFVSVALFLGTLKATVTNFNEMGDNEEQWRIVASSVFTPLWMEYCIDDFAWIVFPRTSTSRRLEDPISYWLIIMSLIPSSYAPWWLLGNIDIFTRMVFLSLGQITIIYTIVRRLETLNQDIFRLTNASAMVIFYILSEISLIMGWQQQKLIYLIVALVSKVLLFAMILFSRELLALTLFKNEENPTSLFTDRRYSNSVYLVAVVFLVFWDSAYVFRLIGNGNGGWVSSSTTASSSLLGQRILGHIVFVLLTAVLPGRLTRRGLLAAEEKDSILREMNYKKTFVRYISHEVRSPLSTTSLGLDCMIDLLEQKQSSNSPDCNIHTFVSDLLELAQDCKTTCVTAISTLSDLLLYDKVESKMLQLECTDLVCLDFLDHCVHPLEKQIKLSGLIWEAHLDERIQEAVVCADQVKLEQVLRNFISNAIKFTCAGGRISLRASVYTPDSSSATTPKSLASTESLSSSSSLSFSNDDNIASAKKEAELGDSNLADSLDGVDANYGAVDEGIPVVPNAEGEERSTVANSVTANPQEQFWVRVEVSDTGPGIAPENVQKLFGQYVQFDANKLQKGGGSGLGLWLSKAIVEAHGGRVGARSAGLGKGSTFYFELPVKTMLVPTVVSGVEAVADDRLIEKDDGSSILTAAVADEEDISDLLSPTLTQLEPAPSSLPSSGEVLPLPSLPPPTSPTRARTSTITSFHHFPVVPFSGIAGGAERSEVRSLNREPNGFKGVPNSSSSSPCLKILIADDAPLARKIVERLLLQAQLFVQMPEGLVTSVSRTKSRRSGGYRSSSSNSSACVTPSTIMGILGGESDDSNMERRRGRTIWTNRVSPLQPSRDPLARSASAHPAESSREKALFTLGDLRKSSATAGLSPNRGNTVAGIAIHRDWNAEESSLQRPHQGLNVPIPIRPPMLVRAHSDGEASFGTEGSAQASNRNSDTEHEEGVMLPNSGGHCILHARSECEGGINESCQGLRSLSVPPMMLYPSTNAATEDDFNRDRAHISLTLNGNCSEMSSACSSLMSTPRSPPPCVTSAPQQQQRARCESYGSDVTNSVADKLSIRIDHATNGQVCVDKVAQSLKSLDSNTAEGNLYDVILIDYYMPVLDGEQAIRQLRSIGYKGCIFALTGANNNEEKEKLMSAGASAVLIKPFDLQRFLTALSKHYRFQWPVQTSCKTVNPVDNSNMGDCNFNQVEGNLTVKGGMDVMETVLEGESSPSCSTHDSHNSSSASLQRPHSKSTSSANEQPGKNLIGVKEEEGNELDSDGDDERDRLSSCPSPFYHLSASNSGETHDGLSKIPENVFATPFAAL
eukprot:gene11027-12277_t